MPELAPSDRLQPSLLDRLTDNHPSETKESRSERVLSVQRIRESVRRDLAWLLNTTNLAAVQDISAYEEAAGSVINFGVPELTGHSIYGLEIEDICVLIKQAVLRFEPRILPDTLRVQGVTDEREYTDLGLAFGISGHLWAQPMPEELYLRTELDLEVGDVTIST